MADDVRDDELVLDHSILYSLCRSPDEEEHVLDYWVSNNYDTTGAIVELKRHRAKIRQRKCRGRKQRKDLLRPEVIHPVEPVVPSDLIPDLKPREELIWLLRSEGYLQTEIAEKLGVSQDTIGRTLRKLASDYFCRENGESSL